MSFRGTRILLVVLVGLMVSGASLDAAEKASGTRTKRPNMADFAEDTKMDVLRWLIKLEPTFAKYVSHFPDTKATYRRLDDYSPRITVIGERMFSGYLVIIKASAEFNDEVTSAKNAKFESFQVLARNALATLPPSHMDEFCKDPDKYLKKTLGGGKK